MTFDAYMKEKTALVEEYLGTCLDGINMPDGLKESMYYSLLAGGKRLRPVLCLAGAGLFGLKPEPVLPFASAIECIHSYSLIHDDLPAMDDDDLRRGKPSNHKQFGEATAILAGDALLTDSFTLMSKCAELGVPAERVLVALHHLAVAAGSSGMVGGQFLDMLYTAQKNEDVAELAYMQSAKTGALITASCVCGGILAGARDGDLEQLGAYGRQLGRAFQIVDDILDETGDVEVLGKPVGSDSAQGKLTYPALVGLEKSRELAEEAGAGALRSLSAFKGEEAEFLAGLVEYVLKRVS